jgi:hypothetical protein
MYSCELQNIIDFALHYSEGWDTMIVIKMVTGVKRQMHVEEGTRTHGPWLKGCTDILSKGAKDQSEGPQKLQPLECARQSRLVLPPFLYEGFILDRLQLSAKSTWVFCVLRDNGLV